MKVLMFGWEFPPYNSGGLGVACQGLARALVAQNIQLVFVLPKKLEGFSESFRFRFADVSGMDIAEVNSLLVPYITSEKYKTLVDASPNGQYGAGLFEEVRRYGVLARHLAQSESFDVIHAHDWLSFGAGIAAKDVSGKPLVLHMHATEIDRTAGKPNQLIYGMEKAGVIAADKVLAVSDLTKKVLVEEYDVAPEKVSVVHNGISAPSGEADLRALSGIMKLKKLGYKIVIFVGRITIMKGPDYFVALAKKVLDYDPKVLFVMAGAGDMEGEVMGKAAALGISNKVLFPGFLRGGELSAIYRSADLFVMPSVAEPFGLTALESLLCGTPVLISKTSGVSEVLKNALKTDFWDVDDMADKTLSVLEHKSLRHELAENGKREASLCNWNSAAEKCVNIYNQLV
jgi:glycosyltransferase involved in cell wall biosynthesis